MVMKRCDKGHFYNGEIFMSCPTCTGAAPIRVLDNFQMDASAAPVYPASEDSVTVPISQQSEDSVTVPISQQSEDSVTVPISRASEDSVTVPISQYGAPASAPAPAGTLQDAVRRVSQPVDDDDEKTVSLYQTKSGIDPVAGWLVCIEGQDFGASFPIKSGRNFVGRSSSMDIVLHGDHSISRERHAVILYEPKRREFLAQAGESRELFYVNDEVVLNPVRLKAHDVLAIGNTSLMFVPLCGENFSWEDFNKK